MGTLDGYAVNLHPPLVAWTATARLPGGTLTVVSTEDLHDAHPALAVTGGTGRYAGAKGEVVLSDAGDRGQLAVVTLHR